MISDSDKYTRLYVFSMEYLNRIKPSGVDLEKYFSVDRGKNASMKDVFLRFIYSAQNYQRMPNVIRFKDRKDEISELLNGFDIESVSLMSSEDLYKTFRERFNVASTDSNHNSWHKWSKSVVDSAVFLKKFSGYDDFVSFVKSFDSNVYTRMALPLLLSEKVSGIGFALACDLLKELGFSKYPKPDVHLIEVFHSLGLSDSGPLSVFEEIVRMSDACLAKDCSATPYKIDKIIWLICSGHYYLEKPEIRIKGKKKEFIELAKERLSYE